MAQDRQDGGAAALAQRLDRIESRAAIADLVHAYARCVRHNQPEGIPALFVPEGTFEVRDGHPSNGQFTLRARYESAQAIGDHLVAGKDRPHPVPLIHNLMIALDGDTATASSVMEAQVFGTPHRVIGEYADSFRRTPDGWRFTARIYTIFGAASSV